MRFTTTPRVIAVLAVATLLTGVGVAIAHEAAAPASSAPKDVSGQQDVNLSPPQMLEQSRAAFFEMETLRPTTAQQLGDARKKKDIVKALCLDDKVRQMKLATDTAKDRVVDLTSAVSQNDADRSKHEFTVIQVLRGRAQALVAEAQQCIGEETGFIGSSDITVNIDPAVPDADPSDFPEDSLVSDPPLISSPTL